MTILALSSSKTPFVRGGAANIIFLVLVIGGIMLWQLFDTFRPVSLAFVAFVVGTMLFGIHRYLYTFVRLEFRDKNLVVVFPIHALTFEYSDIELARVLETRWPARLEMRLKRKGAPFSLKYSIQGPYTPWGTLAECRSKLVAELAAHGVFVEGSGWDET